MQTRTKIVTAATVLFFLALPYLYAVEVWTEVSPNGPDIKPGDLIRVTVKVAGTMKDREPVEVSAYQFSMTYDPAVLRFVQAVPGNLIGDPSMSLTYDPKMYLQYGQFYLAPIVTTIQPGQVYTAATLVFRVVSYGYVALDVYGFDIYDLYLNKYPLVNIDNSSYFKNLGDKDKGHGNDPDHDDEDNPGKGIGWHGTKNKSRAK